MIVSRSHFSIGCSNRAISLVYPSQCRTKTAVNYDVTVYKDDFEVEVFDNAIELPK